VHILDIVRQRMAADFQPTHVMKQVIGIIMSAMYYNAQVTVNYLEAHGMTAQMVQEMIKLKKFFKHEYERRFFIVGLSEMLKCPTLPESLKHLLADLLSNIIEMMMRLNKKIRKRLLAKAQHDLKENDDDEEESDEDSDYYKDYANEQEEPGSDKEEDMEHKDIDDDALGFADKASDDEDQLGFVDKKEDAASDDMEETKDEPPASKSLKSDEDNDTFGSDDDDIDNMVRIGAFDIFLVRPGNHIRHADD